MERILRLLPVLKYIYENSMYGKLLDNGGHRNETACAFAELYTDLSATSRSCRLCAASSCRSSSCPCARAQAAATQPCCRSCSLTSC